MFFGCGVSAGRGEEEALKAGYGDEACRSGEGETACTVLAGLTATCWSNVKEGSAA